MSLDKVLNRPLFRQGALRKGNLKPVRANTGVMVGAPIQDIQNVRYRPPAINQQNFYGRNIRPFFQRTKLDARNFPGSFKQQIMDPKGSLKLPFGAGGGIGRFVSGMGIYDAVSAGTTKLGMQPGYLKSGVDFGLTALGYVNPYVRAAGLGISGLQALRAVGSPVIDYFGQKRGLKPGDTRKALTVDLGKPMFADAFRPRNPEDLAKEVYKKKDVDTRMNIASGRGAGSYPKIDELTQANNETVVGNDKVVDLNKVVQNTGIQTADSEGPQPSGIDGGLDGPVGIEGQDISSKPPAPVKETPDKVAQKILKSQGKEPTQPINGKVYTSNLIERAKEIRAELGMEPQGDTARSMFLTQLAAGLMSGTAKEKGLAGAVKIFGEALGPAVGNYGIMKLKQDELENKSMETYLGYAFDEMKLFNDAAAGEPFDGDIGVLQFVAEDGKIRNIKANRTKDSTYLIDTGTLGKNGRAQYVPIGSSGYIEGLGTVNQFLSEKKMGNDVQKTGKTLSGRYRTFKITQDVLKSIEFNPSSVGLPGKLNLLKSRYGSALNSIGFSIGTSESTARTYGTAYKAQILASDLSDDVKKRLMDETKFETLKDAAKKRIKKKIKGVDSDTLEQLAVAETTLVYALANSFKDKDRLTARDVAAAKELVNIFTLTRGPESVKSSISAIGQQLQDDILRYENDYRRQGGLETTLKSMRTTEGFRLQDSSQVREQFFKDVTQDGLLDLFNQELQ